MLYIIRIFKKITYIYVKIEFLLNDSPKKKTINEIIKNKFFGILLFTEIPIKIIANRK